MYDADFGLVTEGQTDHAVLSNILLGFCKAHQQPREPRINPIHPDEEHFGGWTMTLAYLTNRSYVEAFQLHQYVVVHIDSDVIQNDGLIESKQLADGSIDVDAVVASSQELILKTIGDEDVRKYGDRFILAIAVREIECWILPLWSEQHASKIVGCTATLNNTLSRQGEKYSKTAAGYDAISSLYRKKNHLLKLGPSSPSLKIFLSELDRRNIVLPQAD